VGGGGGAPVIIIFVYLMISAREGPPRLTWVALKPIGISVGSSYPSYRDAYE